MLIIHQRNSCAFLLTVILAACFYESLNAQLITCRNSPCKNNGVCEDQATSSVYGYKCSCKQGWSGINCDISNPVAPVSPQSGSNLNYPYSGNNPSGNVPPQGKNLVIANDPETQKNKLAKDGKHYFHVQDPYGFDNNQNQQYPNNPSGSYNPSNTYNNQNYQPGSYNPSGTYNNQNYPSGTYNNQNYPSGTYNNQNYQPGSYDPNNPSGTYNNNYNPSGTYNHNNQNYPSGSVYDPNNRYPSGSNYGNRPNYYSGPNIGCSSGPCMNNGICQPRGGLDYKCICRYGFTGGRCERYYNPRGTLLGIILGTVIPFIVICIIVTIVVFCCCCRKKNRGI